MKLKNNHIQIKVDQVGAELYSLIDLNNNVEYMWQKSADWWNRTSPVLFPFIGQTYDHKIKIEGETYPTTKHGFMRDKIMDVIESEDSLKFIYTSNEKDYKNYPFKFKLSLIYTLHNKMVNIQYIVENLDNKTMYYSLGAHPAFNFHKGDVAIYKGKDTKRYELEGPYIKGMHDEVVDEVRLDEKAFRNDAIIYSGVDSITLKSEDHTLKVDVSDFDYVGLWSMVKDEEMAPFVSIEPWHGLPDAVLFEGDIKDKLEIQKLEAGKRKILNLTIEI